MVRIGLLLLAIPVYASEIHVSEVMANPQGSEYENEFVELYNASPRVMQIKGWVFSDGKGIDTLVHVSGPERIPPGGFALILDPSYAIISGIYSGIIPEGTPLYSISTDATFGSAGLSNTGEEVLIWNPDSTISSGMAWSQTTENGFSWERVSQDVADDEARWEESRVVNGTPGYQNSVTRVAHDLGIGFLSAVSHPEANQIRVACKIHNWGSQSLASAQLRLRLLQHEDLLATNTLDIPLIETGDSLLLETSFSISRCGWLNIVAEIDSDADTVRSNNSGQLYQYRGCLESPLIVNEIMPLPATGEPEWVELYNRSNRTINLQFWSMSDDNTEKHRLTDSVRYLLSHEYVLLSKSDYIPGSPIESKILEVATFPSLNNQFDAVFIYDPNGNGQDSIRYDASSGLVPGRSYERLSAQGAGAENWRVCVHERGSTPGAVNSLDIAGMKSMMGVKLTPNPFTPNGDGREDIMLIQYELPVPQALMSISIFDLGGHLIAQPASLISAAHKGTVSWDGHATYGGIAITGLYICKLAVDDGEGFVREVFKKIYLVNE